MVNKQIHCFHALSARASDNFNYYSYCSQTRAWIDTASYPYLLAQVNHAQKGQSSHQHSDAKDSV
jgi:hypothetical protein